MLDTVKLRSPKIGEPEACEIEDLCVRRSGLEVGTGELLYEITTGSLKGSWDTRVSVRVYRHEFQPLAQTKEHPEPRSVKVACAPYIEVEGSVHKALMGHNVYGGPEDFGPAVSWFLDNLGARIGCELPAAATWEVLRADWAEVYELPFDAVQLYIRGLKAAEYPWRGQVIGYKGGIGSYGSRSSVKAYSKGIEFLKHDGKRLKSLYEPDQLERLQQIANEKLRWEVEVKAKTLRKDHEHLQRDPRVEDITPDYLRRVHDREVQRLVREGEAEMKTVRKHNEVLSRLHDQYPQRLAGTLFSTWVQLAGLGEDVVRDHMTRPTFYRQRKQLKDAGVSWYAGDVHIDPRLSSLPADFRPIRHDPRHVAGEDPSVVEQLAPYRAA